MSSCNSLCASNPVADDAIGNLYGATGLQVFECVAPRGRVMFKGGPPMAIAAEAIARRSSSCSFVRPALVRVALAMLLIAASAHEVRTGESTVPLQGNHPTASLAGMGPAAADKRLKLQVILALRNQSALDQLLAGQQDPNSPQYHHWLTPNEFHARFGPSPNDVGAIVEWLKSEGLSAVADEAGGRSIRLTVTVAQIERIFGVAIVASADGRLYGNTSDPLIPARFAGVIARIEGLDNLRHVMPLNRSSRPRAIAPPP